MVMQRVSLLMFGLFLGLLIAPAISQPLPRGQQRRLLEQANRAFDQALASDDKTASQGYYQQAIDRYEQLIASGVHNARLYYNLGNAYFLHDDLGRAILNYRRGLRLEPGNPRLRANLRHARNQRLDQFDTSMQQALLPRVLFWHDDVSLHTQVVVALTGFLVAWAGAFVHLFRRRPAFPWSMAGATVVFVLFAGSALLVQARNTPSRHGVIVADAAPVRTGNGESYALLLPRPLHAGAEFEVLEARGSWLHIRLGDGISGWIRRHRAALW